MRPNILALSTCILSGFWKLPQQFLGLNPDTAWFFHRQFRWNNLSTREKGAEETRGQESWGMGNLPEWWEFAFIRLLLRNRQAWEEPIWWACGEIKEFQMWTVQSNKMSNPCSDWVEGREGGEKGMRGKRGGERRGVGCKIQQRKQSSLAI